MTRIAMERSGEMEVFVRVVQDGGFSAAARGLDLTPSAVSKLIGRLERRLGVRLLVRTTRALALTEDGTAYLRAAIGIVQDIEAAELAVGRGTARGRLRVSASAAFGRMFVAPAIPAFLAAHPQLEIDLSMTDNVINLLAARTDVAIRVGPLPDSSLVARKLGESQLVVCASPNYLARNGMPDTPEDLVRHNCLTFNFRNGRPAWPFRDQGHVFEQLVSGNLLLNNGETLRQMALAGAGIARLGLFHVAADIVAGRLVRVLDDFNPRDLEMISAVHVGGGMPPARVRLFIDYLAEAIAGAPVLKEARKGIAC